MPGSLLIISMVHNTPISKTLLDTISQTPWDHEPGFDTKFVTTRAGALAVMSIPNHEGPSALLNLIAEINRILRSGGVFVGTTFLRVNPSAPTIIRALEQSATRTYSYFTKEEIEDLVTSCGLINYTSKVQGSFIMFSAQKC
ncbi:hypothetical protein FXO37_10332 [Capsicum annuum]|nr:hypothetical protein FXO37_10332 [Capsicum annuum]